MLQNDVLAHKTTVEAVNKAGSELIDSSAGEEARGLQNKLENLNQRWKTILEKTEQRWQLLDSALLQVRSEYEPDGGLATLWNLRGRAFPKMEI